MGPFRILMCFVTDHKVRSRPWQSILELPWKRCKAQSHLRFFQGASRARVKVSRPTVNWSWYNSEVMIWLSWRPPSPSSPIQHPIQSSFFLAATLDSPLESFKLDVFCFRRRKDGTCAARTGANAARYTSCPSIQVIMTLRQHWIGKKMPKLWLFCKSYDSWQTPTTLQFPIFFSQLELPSSHSNSFSKMAQL